MTNMFRKRSRLVGRRVRLIKCNDQYTRLEPGAEGTVVSVDDVGTVHVRWDSGVLLGLVWDDGDRWAFISENV